MSVITATTVHSDRPPPAKYNRGNRLVLVTAKIAAAERQALEEQALAEGKSVSAVAREAIRQHVSRAARPNPPEVSAQA
jgi:hypothetical protein